MTFKRLKSNWDKCPVWQVWNEVYRYSSLCYLQCFQRETILETSCLLTWRTKSSQNRVFSLRKEFAPMGANSFLQELTPNAEGGKNENDWVASPELVPIHLKVVRDIIVILTTVRKFYYWKVNIAEDSKLHKEGNLNIGRLSKIA